MELAKLTLTELRRLKTKVESEIRRRSESARKGLLKRIQKMAAEEGLSLDDVLPGGAKKAKAGPVKAKQTRGVAKKKVKAEVKYRNPANPDQGWSGRGRKPQWVLDWLGKGKPLDELAV